MANIAGIMRCAYLFPALMGFVIRFPFVFVIDYFGADWANALINALPDVLLHSFEVMGGILPALGFALTIMVIGKKELIPFFFLGYFAVAYLQIPVMGMAIFGLIIAIVMRMIVFPDTTNVSIFADKTAVEEEGQRSSTYSQRPTLPSLSGSTTLVARSPTPTSVFSLSCSALPWLPRSRSSIPTRKTFLMH